MWLRSDRSGLPSRYRNTQRSRAIRKMPKLTSIMPSYLLVTHKFCGLNHHREWEKCGTQKRLDSLNGISLDSLRTLEHVMDKPASQTAVLSEEKVRVDGWEFE